MTPYQKGITELVGVFKERFGILLTDRDAKDVVSVVQFMNGCRGSETTEGSRWSVYGNTSGQPDMERKA